MKLLCSWSDCYNGLRVLRSQRINNSHHRGSRNPSRPGLLCLVQGTLVQNARRLRKCGWATTLSCSPRSARVSRDFLGVLTILFITGWDMDAGCQGLRVKLLFLMIAVPKADAANAWDVTTLRSSFICHVTSLFLLPLTARVNPFVLRRSVFGPCVVCFAVCCLKCSG